ncbi:MAG: NAD(P)H-hydrate dehydratase [Lachnospiraceae bacterium]|nr:NAD(P)H-hydrate dehydratase [Lachnospiraceae bacterium]
MERVYSSAGMRRIDEYTIDQGFKSARELMETAAARVFDVVWRRIESDLSWQSIEEDDMPICVGVLAGVGNNGGDGIAVVRKLLQRAQDYPKLSIKLLVVGDTSEESNRATYAWREQWDLLQEEGRDGEGAMTPKLSYRHILPEWEYTDDELKEELKECNILVDALFGIGLSRPVTGVFAQVVRAAADTDCPVIAVDMPSGVSTDSGAVLGVALPATTTVTFGYRKRGQVLLPGRELCGELIVADIGFASDAPVVALSDPFSGSEIVRVERPDIPKPTYVWSSDDIAAALPKRPAYSHKGTFGTTALVAGSRGMAGAALIGAMAAYRGGAGLVMSLSDAENRLILQTGVPEAIFLPWQSGSSLDRLLGLDPKRSAIVIGPGLGANSDAKQVLQGLLKALNEKPGVPLLLDADALNLIAKHETIDRLVRDYTAAGGAVILTPHVGELIRLLGRREEWKDAQKVRTQLPAAAQAVAKDYGAICVAKDASTVIAMPDGELVLNPTGCAALAVGGSGDALAGLIGSLLAQGADAKSAAVCGVWIHGRAGEEAARKVGMRSCMARDIVDGIASVYRVDFSERE